MVFKHYYLFKNHFSKLHIERERKKNQFKIKLNLFFLMNVKLKELKCYTWSDI